MDIIVGMTAVVSTTLGQSFLLQLLFPGWMMVHGIWVLISLLLFNCGLGGILLILY